MVAGGFLTELTASIEKVCSGLGRFQIPMSCQRFMSVGKPAAVGLRWESVICLFGKPDFWFHLLDVNRL